MNGLNKCNICIIYELWTVAKILNQVNVWVFSSSAMSDLSMNNWLSFKTCI